MGIFTNTLPAAWRDAAHLTRLMGFKYLWVDGLCILQDDIQSWIRESSRCPDYFREAHLTIASALTDYTMSMRRSRPFGNSLLRLTYNSPTKNLPELSSEISIRVPLEDSGTELVRSMWAQRGWTMSERYLSARMLIIGEEQTYWNCNTLLWSEGSTEPQRPLWRLSCSGFPTRSAALGRDRSMWYSLVEYHTSKSNMTHERDRLVSLGSLATALAGGDRYWAGIWQDDMHVGLVWRRLGHAAVTFGSKVPSWSWGCLTGSVSFRASAFNRLETSADAQIIEISLSVANSHGDAMVELSSQRRLRSVDEPFQYCQILSGYLILIAFSRSVRVANPETPSMYVFDQDYNERGEPWAQIPFTTVLISQWVDFSGNSYRWHGLLLHKVDESNKTGPERYRRVGVYIGSLRKIKHSKKIASDPIEFTGLEDDWERKKFRIV